MKIYILIPWFYPAYKAGGPVQSIANMVRALGSNNLLETTGNEGEIHSETNYQFSIFCSNKDLDGSLLEGVTFDKWLQFKTNTKIWYSSIDNILPVLKKQIKKEKPDFLFITGIYDWVFNIKPLLFCSGVKKIISVRGMLHPGALSQKNLKKKIYLGLWKTLGVHKKNVFHATDEAEAQHIKDEFGEKAKIFVAENFGRLIKKEAPINKSADLLKLFTIALISPMKNHLNVLKALKMCKSDIEYNIYGPIKDEAYWQLCLQQIKLLPTNISVQYHGDLAPHLLEETLSRHHVFIMPSKSENFGHAISEALSAGKPVITSNATPWNNLLQYKAGINAEPTETALHDAIDLFSAMDNEMYLQFAEGAAAYIRRKNNYEIIMEQYRKMFAL